MIASFLVLGSSCESSPSVSSRVASSRDGSLEVRRLHSARGPVDRNRVLRPDSHPPPGFVPLDGLLPTGRADGSECRRRSRDSPLEACPRPDRCRFPGPCPPAVSRRPSFGSSARSFRASIPGRSCPRSWIDLAQLPQGSPLGSSPPPPWLTVCLPGHPLVRFPRRRRVPDGVRRSRVLRSGRVGLPSPAADPYGFFDLTVARGCSPAPNSSSQGSATRLAQAGRADRPAWRGAASFARRARRAFFYRDADRDCNEKWLEKREKR